VTIAWPLRAIRRTPFTLAMVAAVAVVALLTDTQVGPLRQHLLDTLGFAPRDMTASRWAAIFTSALVTYGGWTLAGVLFMVVACVGSAERAAGTRTAALTFWGVHVLVLVLLAFLLRPPGLEPFAFAIPLLPLPRDVGPSAGYFACLGLRVAYVRSRKARAAAGFVVFAALGVALFVPSAAGVDWRTELLADVAHVASFGIGWGIHALRGIPRHQGTPTSG
jgi:hypothetical protein